MPRPQHRSLTVGGITYPTSAGDPGDYYGFHCRECMEKAVEYASLATTAGHQTARMRLAIIQFLPRIAPNWAAWSREALQVLFLGLSLDDASEVPSDFTGHPVLITFRNYCRHPNHTNLAAVNHAIAATRLISESFTCISCEEEIQYDPLSHSHRRLNDGYVQVGTPTLCRMCLDTDFWFSEEEGRWHNNDMRSMDVRGVEGPVSEDYAEEHFRFDDEEDEWTSEDVGMSLLSYSADPFSHHEWDSRNRPNALVFGVELEMEPRVPSERTQRAVVAALGGGVGRNFILKSDGSLNCGIELVTMPFTLSQHLDGSGVDWKAINAAVKDIARSGVDTTACGIHIHINKKALSALTIGKMLVFLNAPGLTSLVTSIAQRSNSSYCTRSSKKLTDGTRSSENRYDIMNVSVRHPTCEVRMFRGNLTVERIYKNIEFCHALVQYCRQSSMRSLTDWGNFSQWLIKNRGIYSNLVRFLIDSSVVGFRQLGKDSRDGQVAIVDL